MPVRPPATLRPDLLILCGGEATRLGGIDKPLRMLAGRPLIEHVLAAIGTPISRVLVSANRHAEAYAQYGAVLADGEFAGCGPLAGLAAGLGEATSEALLCVPGDAPWLPTDLARRLDAARAASGSPISYAFDGLGPQPLCSLLDRGLQSDLLAYLRAGGRRPREWFARHQAVAADFSEFPLWAWSLNTPDEWQLAEQQLAALKLRE